jgi:hypothetical protein
MKPLSHGCQIVHETTAVNVTLTVSTSTGAITEMPDCVVSGLLKARRQKTHRQCARITDLDSDVWTRLLFTPLTQPRR